MEVKVNQKHFVRVIADMRPGHQILPVAVFFDGKKRKKIDGVADIRRVLVKDLGEQCMAYFCEIDGARRVIYLDSELQWFVV